MNEKFTVGQQLYFVPSSRYGSERTYVIEKVGRKYITLDNGMRAPVDKLYIENYGKLYLSEEHYRQYIAADTAWETLRRRFYYSAMPEDITAEKIEQATKLLFGE